MPDTVEDGISVPCHAKAEVKHRDRILFKRESTTFSIILPAIKRSGFTLLEVLVATLVVAVAAALLVPAVGKAKERANRAACASNLRNLGNAFNFYVQDRGSYPTVYGGWYPLLLPYIGEDPSKDIAVSRPKVLRCPENRAHDWTIQKLSYGYNSFLGNNYSSATNIVSLRPANFTHPSRVILCGDVDSRLPAPGAVINYNRVTGSPPGVVHNGGANLLYVDGHTEWKVPSEVTETPGHYTLPILRMWGMYGYFAE